MARAVAMLNMCSVHGIMIANKSLSQGKFNSFLFVLRP